MTATRTPRWMATRPVAASALPRHRQIADRLRSEIERGKYPVGSQLPTEEELLALHQASRATIRTALQALTQEGLIVRRPRIGSTVVATRASSVLAQQVESVQELLAYPADSYRTSIGNEFIKAGHELATLIKCEHGAEWFRMSMLRFPAEGDVPICWTDVYVLPQYAGVVRHPHHLRTPVCTQILDMYDESLERASVEVFAGGLPRHMAKALKATSLTPALYVIRRYRGRDGKAYEISVSVHPEKRFRLGFELQRELRVLRRTTS